MLVAVFNISPKTPPLENSVHFCKIEFTELVVVTILVNGTLLIQGHKASLENIDTNATKTFIDLLVNTLDGQNTKFDFGWMVPIMINFLDRNANR